MRRQQSASSIAIIVLLLAYCSVITNAIGGWRPPRSGRRTRLNVTALPPNTELSNLYSFRSTGAATDEMSTPDTPGLECGTQCSFGFRVRTDAGNIAADRFFTKRDDANTQATMSIDTSATSPYSVRLTLCANITCGALYSVTTRTGATPSVLNLFTSVVVTVNYSTSTALVYVDGARQILTISGAFPAAWIDSTSEWAVAANNAASGGREMSGWFDDVWIDPDYEWTAEEVYAWHNKRGSRTFPTGITVGTWCRGGDDNAGAGVTCTDASGNGRNWTLAGSGVFQAVVPAKITLAAVAPMNRSRVTFAGIGQSNEGGRGTIGDLTGSEFPNAGRCYNYDNNGPIGTPNGTTTPCAEPWDVNTGQAAVFPATDDATTGVGPMVRMADRILQTHTQREVGVIPCAIGNSNSYVFSVAHGAAVTANQYAECEGRFTQTAIGNDSELAGFVVYQGENDASLAVGEADEWDYRWQAYVEAYRDHVGRRDIPVVVVILPVTPGSASGPQHSTVRDRQALVCGKLDYCSTVQAPTAYMADGIHQTTAAQITLGDLLGDAMLATAYHTALVSEQTQFDEDTRGWEFDGCDTAGGCAGAEEYTTVADNALLECGGQLTHVAIYRVDSFGTSCAGAPCTNDQFVGIKGTNINDSYSMLSVFESTGSFVRYAIGGLTQFGQTNASIGVRGNWVIVAATYGGGGADNDARLDILTSDCPRTNGGQPVCGALTDRALTFNGTIPATISNQATAFTTGGIPGTGFNHDGAISEQVIFCNGKVTAADLATCVIDGTRARFRDLNAMSGACAAIFSSPVLWLGYGDKSGDNPASQLGNKFVNALGNSTPVAMEGSTVSTIGDQFFHGL